VERIPAADIHAASDAADTQKLILSFQECDFSTSFARAYRCGYTGGAGAYYDNFSHLMCLHIGILAQLETMLSYVSLGGLYVENS